MQASVNQQLNKAVGTPYGASAVQLTVAAAALAVLAAAVGAIGAVGLVAEVEPWWLLLGGIGSPLYITAGILLFPRLGALTSVGLFVTGQVFASLALDLFGLLAVPRQPLGLGIVLGALAVLAGAVLPIQGAINAQLQRDIGSPFAVGTVSFAVATMTIAIVLAVLLALRRTPTPRLRPLRVMPWWGWLGGFCAGVYVTATFLLIPTIGAAVTVALTVTGQQLASALIDQNGWFGMQRRPLTSPRIGGLALLIAGSVLVQLT